MKTIDTTQTNINLAELVARDLTDVSTTVAEILLRVQKEGDQALIGYTKRFDGITTTTPRIMMRDELETYCNTTAQALLSDQQKTAIETAVRNVTWCAHKTIPQGWSDIAPDGQRIGETFTPFSRIACYVPQGSFPLVSTAIHTAAIAQASGVQEIVMVTSPNNDDLNPGVAYAAYLSGVTEIIFVGGAQGIAAVAYGTQTIRPVDFICGPGNQYVAQAKRQLYGTVGIDMVAGPSEVFVVGDNAADPYAIACDLVAQAEHGSGYEAAVLLTDSQEIIDAVTIQLESIKDSIVDNPGFLRVWDNSLYLVLTSNIDQALDYVNQCAPEHVEIQTSTAQQDAIRITRAGAVFIGGFSAEPLGDFVAGPSHVLPTNATARFQSGLSAASFFRRTSTIECDESSYEKLAPFAYEFAQMEGLIGHGLSSIARLTTSTSKDTQ